MEASMSPADNWNWHIQECIRSRADMSDDEIAQFDRRTKGVVCLETANGRTKTKSKSKSMMISLAPSKHPLLPSNPTEKK